MRIPRLLLPFLALTLAGAGCASSDGVAIPADRANGETALRLAPSDLDFAPPPAPPPPDASGSSAVAESRPSMPTGPVGVLPDERIMGKRAIVTTPKGDITFDLLADQAPLAVSNFVALAESGYFDGLTFHRVEPRFVIQGGDPKGNGTGGPGYTFPDEPVTLDYDAGIVAMANAGPDTNGSQFFIVLEDQPALPKNYTIFGRVTAGMDAVRAIRVGDTMDSVSVGDR